MDTGIHCVTKHCESTLVRFVNSYYKKFYGSMMRLVKRYFCGKCGIYFSIADYEINKKDVQKVQAGNQRIWELVEPKIDTDPREKAETSEPEPVAVQ